MNSALNNLLEEYGCKNPDNIKETVISECKLSVLQLRDVLFQLGNVLYENLDDQIYVTTVRAGYGNLNSAIVALKLYEGTLFVAGYAKEGIIKQNICEHAFQKLTDVAQGKNVNKPVNRKMAGISIIGMIIMVSIIIIGRDVRTSDLEVSTNNVSTDLSQEDSFQEIITSSDEELNTEIDVVLGATKDYNDAVEAFNQCVAEYNSAVKITCIDNIEGFPKSIESLSVVSENRDDIKKVVQGNNSKEKIVADTETLLEMTEQLEQALTIVRQITAPSEEWVAERLIAIKEVTGIEAVTEDQNPDGLLGKEGGYSACIYFTTPSAVPEEVPGVSIVEKGTDAGGAVEIYANLEDAEARVEYLAGFDGTVLYSGSYAIVGTMVIRTSYKLSNERQLQMTNLITNELTKISEIE